MLRITFEKMAATVTSIDTKLDRHGPEEKVVRVYVNFKATVEAKWLDKLGVDSKVDWLGVLFEDNGEIKESGLEKLTFNRVYEEHQLTIQMDNLSADTIKVDDVTVKNIYAAPEFGGKIKIHMQAQFNPSDDEYLFIRDSLIKDQVIVSVKEPPQQDMLDGAGSSNVVSI